MPLHYRRTLPTDRERRTFGAVSDAMDFPDLIEIQRRSYKWFYEEGVRELFAEVNPIRDFIGRDLELYFDDYYLDEPKFDEKTSRVKNVTYEAPLRVKTRLVNLRAKTSKEQEIYLGDLPIMTPRGTFVINGVDRVIVSQLVRSAGAFFTADVYRGRRYYGAKIIPNRGAWLEFETDPKNVIWVKIDRKRKVAVTSLLRAFGCTSEEEIINYFKDVDIHPINHYIESTLNKDAAKNEDEGLIEVYKRIRPGDRATAENARSLIHSMFFNFDRYDLGKVGRYKFNLRFGDTIATEEVEPEEKRIITKEDLVKIIREIISLNISQDDPDDVDHLGNRRVRAVGELIQSRFRVGLARMERIIKDRMSTQDIDVLTPGRLINARPVIGAVREFFMSSQLSQFMDQTNPLAELEHKRRLSAMGPGGLSRERAGFEVRDVHPTHYGRICPIATPEGPNIGLIGHLASYAIINDYGFIETPYRKVVKEEKDGKTIARVTDEIEFINAFKEERSVTVPATTPIDDKGYFTQEFVSARRHAEPKIVTQDEIDYMDVSSKQIVSIGTALIPFLEHDDATRALMGTNMQRQAVPTVKPDAPIIGTGVEKRAARDSGHIITTETDGEVTKVDGKRIEITDAKDNVTRYDLNKFLRSNHSTCINQKPVVDIGQKVKKGDVLADSSGVDHGEIALGQNVLVAFMAWDGYNYEDAVIISERLVHDDRYTSVHIEHYNIDVRDTKLGPEVVTSDIPNVSEEKLKNLDAEGIIRIGAEVKSGDILVGKITPKGETELSAEEKLLRAIFGEKARDVRDSSLYLEHGEHGKVVDVILFSREAGDKLSPGVIKQVQVTIADLRKVQVGDKVAGRHGNKGVISKVVPMEDMPFLPDGTPLDVILTPLGVVSRMNLGQILEVHLGLAANALGYHVSTPVLNGVSRQSIESELERAGFPKSGQLTLYDGRSGEPFGRPITVGYMYVLKLAHMVEDKIHQRSIGPYSLITQQPLGGKAQFGGQRFGEMEVWALEAYGAAHTLQEILTIKSDDITGRSKAYESIIKGEPIKKVNIPESFNVLIRELKGLCLDVELLKNGEPVELGERKSARAGKGGNA
ncbi:TPA: DNA-directed RNA polymerase subunit beta [Candidatus Uhrbacteria bacterium]|uniref:DNA-directed RNA polymerase subunit beta n=2 Tax=Candidatus Uhriibacteriota TaxID=1752732 RepID=A0A0G1Q693_9BACT|nr:MAG: DNA-directed RNA polymerase subunit beta [Candidatus Uhrbacteria bacterium GW2011_GWF2_46_218]KKU40581.1 MAG: DNA-directed RNA polymerase subunit beta [Candidatus Uhrbacteria bacterium GW2011_GWE2_46_68]HBK33425.1 DNA-directed RNA polymerase subunit beta [Candidatus Uhrbacteria bacterium]HCB18836.1 DNA-directed RNA polymerase subunit beta [Candidatus Uhrbacteria bacterium]